MPLFNRGFRGLYGNKRTRFGNKVSFAENKSRRTWKPNVQKKSVFSETLQRKFTFRMTTRVIKTIKKVGGIDEYLVRTRDSEIKYDKAIDLKNQIISLRAEQVRVQEEAKAKLTPITSASTADSTHSPLQPSPVTKFRSRGLLDLL